MDRTDPLISIIMPALNAAPFIGEAIRSVQTQTWLNWELVIVDNGSSDGTASIVENVGDPRVLLLHERNKGVGHARNKALQMIKGEFYCFLDADDRLPPSSLADRAALLLADPTVHFADGAIHAFSQDQPHEWTRVPRYRGDDPLNELYAITDACFLGLTWMIRRTGTKVPLFRTDMSHAEDMLYFMTIAHAGAYDHVDKPVLEYRIGHGSAMSDLKGLHEGYRQLVRHMPLLPHPPDRGTLARAWWHMRMIMCKSYLKRGRFLDAASSILEKIPLPAASPKVAP